MEKLLKVINILFFKFNNKSNNKYNYKKNINKKESACHNEFYF